MTEFFYNDTQPAFAETRIITEKLHLSFVGSPPFVVKPGMPFEGLVSIVFQDQVALSSDDLNESSLDIQAIASFADGTVRKLKDSKIRPTGIEETEGIK